MSRVHRLLGVSSVFMTLMISSTGTAAPPDSTKLMGTPAQYAQNSEVLVVYKEGEGQKTKASAEAAGFEVLEDYKPGKYLVCRPKPSVQSVATRANKIAGIEGVRYVEPNYLVSIPEPAGPAKARAARALATAKASAASAVTSNDPLFSKLWGMENAKVTEAWNTTKQSDVVVGVIDSGIDYTHQDLAANMWVNPGETSGDGLDNDGNGIVDDVFGAKFANSIGSGDPMDDNSHGSHCAGTIGAVGDNSIGVVGVNWNIKIMALKFLDASGSGFTNDAVRCIDYAVAQKQAGVNIRILSNSWGGGGPSNALKEAIERANTAGILFVAASGNESADNEVSASFPSNYDIDNVIAVMSINRREERSWFSNWGATKVDLAAPGGTLEGVEDDDIWSTVPKSLDTNDGNKDGYAAFSGTSMATPHVSGALALVWSTPAHASKSPSEMKQLILSKTRPIPALAGFCVTGGTLDLSFLKSGGSETSIGAFVYAGKSDGAGGAFSINGKSGTAAYVLGESAYESKLIFVGNGNAPDGTTGWIFREDYPILPFDFLLTDKAASNGKFAVYTRPAGEDSVDFALLSEALRGATVNATDIGSLRKDNLNKLRQTK